MFAIAFMGLIMHELTPGQLRAVVDGVKKVAGNQALIVCNASGLFSVAPALAAQVKLLFDSGIDIIFAGEQSIARHAGRDELDSSAGRILRPVNLDDSAPGQGTELVSVGDKKIWLICAADQSPKTPLEHAHEVLDDFFSNKNDSFPVLINVNGKDSDYKKALALRYSQFDFSVAVIGSGMHFSSGTTRIDNGNAFQADAGIIASLDSVSGMSPDIWWKRNIERIPVAILPGRLAIEADYTVLFYDCEKIVKSVCGRLVV